MTERYPRGIVIAALLCLAGVSACAQPTPVIRTETRVVLVDAIVTNKQGEYVRGLTAKDFRLWEDNKEQTIQSVSLEQGSSNARPRYLVLFFAGMSATDQLQSRQTISDFIDANAQENRKMAVVSYGGELRIDQNFTDDAGRLKEGATRAISSGLTAGTADSAALNTLRALVTLATNLRVLPGRKIIILMSGGLQQSSMQKSELLAALEACNKSDVAVYPVDVRPLSSQMGNKNDVRSASEGPNTVPGIRVRGLDQLQGDARDAEVNPQEPATGSQQILFALANGTGGFVIPNFTELQRGLQRIGEEQAEYYTISYAPPESPSGSKGDDCHKLRVKVDRSGTAIRARTNYCATKPQDLLAGTSTGQDLERRAVGAQSGSIAASIELSYFYISPDVARAYLAMDIPPDALKFEKRKGKLHAELNFLGIAYRPGWQCGSALQRRIEVRFRLRRPDREPPSEVLALRETVQDRTRPLQLRDCVRLREREFREAGNAPDRGRAVAGRIGLKQPGAEPGDPRRSRIGAGWFAGRRQHAADCGKCGGCSFGLQSICEIRGRILLF